MKTEFHKLAALCKKWGGKITVIEDDFIFDIVKNNKSCSMNNELDAGYFHKNKSIIAKPTTDWPSIIHEMGHVFVDNILEEEYMFFGWEWALCNFIDGNTEEWLADNKGYVVSYGDKKFVEFGELSSDEQSEVLSERLIFAKKNNLVNSKNEPLSIR